MALTVCPTCSGPIYDNTVKNQERIAAGQKPMPQYKCRDESCGWLQWPPKGAKGQRAPATPKVQATWKQVAATYKKSREVAEWAWDNALADDAKVQATATVFIQACREGLLTSE